MDNEAFSLLLQKYLEVSATDLFADLGAAFHRSKGEAPLPEVTAILGIAGPCVAGSLALCTSAATLGALAKLGQAAMPEDWLGELANQLVGRLKRRLSSHGVDFSLGTPTIVSGERLHVVVGLAHERGIGLRLVSDLGLVEVWLEFELHDGCEIYAEPTENGALREGEAVLF